MTKRITLDVTKFLPQHVCVGDCVEITMETHEGSVKMLMDGEDFKRLARNDFFIEPDPGEKYAGIIATTETYITE